MDSFYFKLIINGFPLPAGTKLLNSNQWTYSSQLSFFPIVTPASAQNCFNCYFCTHQFRKIKYLEKPWNLRSWMSSWVHNLVSASVLMLSSVVTPRRIPVTKQPIMLLTLFLDIRISTFCIAETSRSIRLSFRLRCHTKMRKKKGSVCCNIWGFPKMVVPSNHGFSMVFLLKMISTWGGDWGYHHLRKTPILKLVGLFWIFFLVCLMIVCVLPTNCRAIFGCSTWLPRWFL